MQGPERTADDDLSTAQFEQILNICDDFEAKWRRGERPCIEEFLTRHPSLPRPALFRELLALELELARAEGGSQAADEYRAAFPELIPVIDEVFADNGPKTAGSGTNRPVATDPSEALANTPSLPHPARIGRYTVLSLLDEGAQGQVFRVVHPALGKDLVLKLAARPVADEQYGRELLKAEGRLLAQLDHPNLVRVLDLDVHDGGRLFLVMEYVAGCSLDRHIQHGLPAPRRAAALVAEIARAVDYVHGQGVVHQDIKPRNVLIDEAGRPRLIDFGLARLRHAWADETSGPSGGTLLFMAPEQARGEVDRVGPAADIHALGALLYYLLTRRPPISGGSRSEIYERVRRGAIDTGPLESSAASRRLRQICLKALAPEPAGRFATANELARQLDRVARGPRRAITIGASLLLFTLLLFVLALKLWSHHSLAPLAHVEEDQELVHIVGRDRPYDLREALPLRSGDQLRLSCKIPHGTCPSMFWLDSEGAVTELTPEVMTGETTDSLRYPPAGAKDAVRLEGSPGTEFLLVCARPNKPFARREIEAILGAGGPLPALPEKVILRLKSDGVEASGPSGLRSISGPVESDLSAALSPLRRLQRKLRAGTSFLSGIAFPHVAK
jgi:serine/threonine protein kinase